MEKLPEIIHESWHEHLQPLFDNRKMQIIKYKILPGSKFYPKSQDIFKVFSMPLNQIKVVILGQDPYPNGEATGLAFAVNKENPKPKSLQIIEREIKKDYPKPNWVLDRTLSHWTQQGIFLLNTALTVPAKDPGVHIEIWKWFTVEVIKVISKEVSPIWLLWGSKAQYFEPIIKSSENFLVNDILKAPHPAAEVYPNAKTTFADCHHFFLTNKLLKEKGLPIINW